MTDLPIDLPPDPAPAALSFTPPPGSCDCHFHVFVHDDRYPFSARRGYTPAAAGNDVFRRLQQALGLERAVLIHPTSYGTDNRLLLDTLADNPNYRGIAVFDRTVGDDALLAMSAAGVRGLRITTVAPGGVPIAQLDELAARIARFGWHLQLFVNAETMMALAPRLPTLPVPVVLDHLAGMKADHAPASRELDTVRGLLATGRVWVKISGAYRASLAGPPYRDTTPLAQALIAAAPDRLVWGSDWPHPNLRGKPMPNDGVLLDLLAAWAPDPAVRRKILVDNPVALYGFPAA